MAPAQRPSQDSRHGRNHSQGSGKRMGTALQHEETIEEEGFPFPDSDHAEKDYFGIQSPGTNGHLVDELAQLPPPPKAIGHSALHHPTIGNPHDAAVSSHRKNVQFSEPDTLAEGRSPSHEGTAVDSSTYVKLISKFRTFATTPLNAPSHSRSQSSTMHPGDSTQDTTPTNHSIYDVRGVGSRNPPAEEGEADGDFEDSGAEAGLEASPSRRKGKSRVPRGTGIASPLRTPSPTQYADINSGQGHGGTMLRPLFPIRRATMMDIPEDERLGLSEDEGRDRLRPPINRLKHRGSSWMHSRGPGGASYRKQSPATPLEGHAPPRPSPFRRFTNLGGSSFGADSSWRMRSEVGAQKWRQLKAGLKLMGQKRKEENTIDHAKSAELMAELLAGSPAAIIMASAFLRDDGEKKKIPVLLEQLKIKISDSQRREDSSGDRHVVFRIELEYGSGLMRMKWVIYRSLKDFANLHVKYKLQSGTNKLKPGNTEDKSRAKLPRFPKSAFPYLRGVRGLAEESDEEDEAGPEEASGPEGQSSTERPSGVKRRTSSFNPMRRHSSTQDGDVGDAALRRETYADKQRKKLEVYLREMIRFLIFRPGSNRLCRFLELSALGIRLAAEGGYHGKEGSLVLQSGKGNDFRRAWKPNLIVQRHKPMWFLVRHSYLVCVDSPEEMNIYDVYLIDHDFTVQSRKPRVRDQRKAVDIAKAATNSAAHPHKHVLRLENSERTFKLLAKNERQLLQFEESIKFMVTNTIWAQKHRFDSFAPVRKNVFAQWLVDGRDYMWNVSRAISMAQDVIYIHDWWLSPELYMRRPSAISHKWRLDRLLKKKAEEGVKIFVIMYRNINSAVPIDSEYTKFSLLDLHPNIFVQRSPNQYKTNVFFWAHHEKICVVDHTIAFCGGVDLCFGRWDTPQHSVVDDKLTGFEPTDTPRDADHCQLWPGKDYSNPRVLDFFRLDDPYGEMYDRSKVPRMPWHDIGMQIVGQPARDLTRHFVQRWNYLLRQRKPTRPTPFLLPPPDFNPADLASLGLDGTCNIQILRSASEWSIGTPNKVEHSIMNAYVKLIEKSDHFVYIENQFFISSCEVDGTKVHNSIGDALVERIIRAAANQESWLAVIVIPLMPGFQNTVDQQDGTSVRLIMQYQFRSINRGESSIFGRLRAAGLHPEDWIQFYSLRSWGKIGPSKALVTEQLYIHAKIMVVDDRYAIIGSANINERSMLGSRDSEVAAVVWDSDMLDSTMAGEPYKVGRFAHTLRMRLMREHLGVDVDEVMDEEREEETFDERRPSVSSTMPPSIASDHSMERELIASKHRAQDDLIAKSEAMRSFNHDADVEQAHNPHIKAKKKFTSDRRVTNNTSHRQDVEGFGFDHMHDEEEKFGSVGRDSVVIGGREVLVDNLAPEGKGTMASPKEAQADESLAIRAKRRAEIHQAKVNGAILPPKPPRMNTEALGLTMLSQLPALPDTDDTDIGGPPLTRSFSKASGEAVNPLLASMRHPVVDKDCMKDPLNDAFFQDTWHTVAENNTKLFRQVFRCMPDNLVTSWKEYEASVAYGDRFAQSQGMSKSNTRMQQESKGKTGPPGTGITKATAPMHIVKEKLTGPSFTADDEMGGISRTLSKQGGEDAKREDAKNRMMEDEKASPVGVPETTVAGAETASPTADHAHVGFEQPKVSTDMEPARSDTVNDEKRHVASGDVHRSGTTTGPRRRRRATTKSSNPLRPADQILTKAEAEELMNLVQGSLVVFPYDWWVFYAGDHFKSFADLSRVGSGKKRKVVNGYTRLIPWRQSRSSKSSSLSHQSYSRLVLTRQLSN